MTDSKPKYRVVTDCDVHSDGYRVERYGLTQRPLTDAALPDLEGWQLIGPRHRTEYAARQEAARLLDHECKKQEADARSGKVVWQSE